VQEALSSAEVTLKVATSNVVRVAPRASLLEVADLSSKTDRVANNSSSRDLSPLNRDLPVSPASLPPRTSLRLYRSRPS
jgi:hypothetical protein